MAGEKTEAPSARRLQELRSRGQVVPTTDLTAAVGLPVSLLLLRNLGGNAANQMQGYLQHSLTNLGSGDLTESSLAGMGTAAAGVMASSMMPLFAGLPIVAIAI